MNFKQSTSLFIFCFLLNFLSNTNCSKLDRNGRTDIRSADVEALEMGGNSLPKRCSKVTNIYEYTLNVTFKKKNYDIN